MGGFDFGVIGPTALLLVYLRQFSDIPFAREVAEVVGAEEKAAAFLADGGGNLEDLRGNAPFAEARYKCIGREIRRLGLDQVLELGAGLSFRGLAWDGGADRTCVETDLPSIVELKHAIVERLPEMRTRMDRGNVSFRPADVLRLEELRAALAPFDPARPLAVVNEGLLGYLLLEEKEIVARNVREVLLVFGGAWITPDLHTRPAMDEHAKRYPKTASGHAAVARATTRDFAATAFDDEEHVARFFGRLGFTIEARPQIDDSFEISSLRRLGLPDDLRKDPLPKVWILRLADRPVTRPRRGTPSAP